MRVLHVNKFLYRRGGAEAYVFDLAALQARHGHDVAFYGMAHPENGPQEFERFFPSHLDYGSPLSQLQRAAAFQRMLWSPSSGRGLHHVIEAFRPDIVHMHNVYHQLSPAILTATSRAGVPVVMTLHDYKLACPSYQMLDHGRVCDACVEHGPWQAARRRCKDGSFVASTAVALETWVHRVSGAWAGVDAFVCPSRFLAKVMKRADLFPDRMHVVRHFVDVPPRSEGPQAIPGRFVIAGRLSHEKGVDVAIRAVAATGTSSLHIAGEGPSRPALEDQARAQAPRRVRFYGRLERDDVLGLMRTATAVLLPSRWHENQPIAALEALAAGVPVVSTSLGGMPEILENGITGLLVPPDDAFSLARALEQLNNDPAETAQMGASARRFAEREFSPEVHLRRLEAVYAAAASVKDRQPVPQDA